MQGKIKSREEYCIKLLKDKIISDGMVKEGNILKVDSFLNHQIDINLGDKIGEEFHRLFGSYPITKILTIEASGIGLACLAARHFNVPVVFAKKAKSKNLTGELYRSTVSSYTYGMDYDIVVAKRFLTPEDNLLVIDDFLAKGKALMGLIDIINQSGATLCGAGIVIEKGFQDGGKIIRDMGVNLHSLAIVESMDENSIVFR